jgi:hypothetical protein
MRRAIAPEGDGGGGGVFVNAYAPGVRVEDDDDDAIIVVTRRYVHG